jgi:hypothetical protein
LQKKWREGKEREREGAKAKEGRGYIFTP